MMQKKDISILVIENTEILKEIGLLIATPLYRKELLKLEKLTDRLTESTQEINNWVAKEIMEKDEIGKEFI